MIVDGVEYIPGLCPGLFDGLMAEFAWEQRHITLYGKTAPIPRLTSWAGQEGYTYSGITNDARPWGPIIESLRSQWEFSGVLANLYRDGRDCVSWHADDEVEDDRIISISVGATRRFSVRHNETREVRDYELSDGDVIIMSRGMQTEWQHCIRRTAKAVWPRINLTLRGLT